MACLPLQRKMSSNGMNKNGSAKFGLLKKKNLFVTTFPLSIYSVTPGYSGTLGFTVRLTEVASHQEHQVNPHCPRRLRIRTSGQ